MQTSGVPAILMPVPACHITSAEQHRSADGLVAFGTDRSSFVSTDWHAFKGHPVFIVVTGLGPRTDGEPSSTYQGKLEAVHVLDGKGPYPGYPAHRPPSTKDDEDFSAYLVISGLGPLSMPCPVSTLASFKTGKMYASHSPRTLLLASYLP